MQLGARSRTPHLPAALLLYQAVRSGMQNTAGDNGILMSAAAKGARLIRVRLLAGMNTPSHPALKQTPPLPAHSFRACVLSRLTSARGAASLRALTRSSIFCEKAAVTSASRMRDITPMTLLLTCTTDARTCTSSWCGTYSWSFSSQRNATLRVTQAQSQVQQRCQAGSRGEAVQHGCYCCCC